MHPVPLLIEQLEACVQGRNKENDISSEGSDSHYNIFLAPH